MGGDLHLWRHHTPALLRALSSLHPGDFIGTHFSHRGSKPKDHYQEDFDIQQMHLLLVSHLYLLVSWMVIGTQLLQKLGKRKGGCEIKEVCCPVNEPLFTEVRCQ